MLLGLVFREKAKEKRSIMSWRKQAKGLLPQVQDMRPAFARPQSGFMGSFFSGSSDKSASSETVKDKSGYGFGTAGEKKAGLKGKLDVRTAVY